MRRDALTKLQIESFSDEIASRLWMVPGSEKARRIGVYASIGSEVHTDRIINELLRRKKHVFATRIEKPDLVFKRIEGLNDLHKGTFKIRQPSKDLPTASVKDLDVILIPGIAFDERGHRIGFGAGYYDRCLEKRDPRTLLIALAYELQIIEHIDTHQHDVPVDLIVTEKRIITCR